MKYIDIHCHLDHEKYEPDRLEILRHMQKAGIGVINIGTNFDSSEKAIALAEDNEDVWACIGVHPIPREGEHLEFDEDKFKNIVLSPKVVAIGECGLDYFRIEGNMESQKEKQRKVFEAQLAFAIKFNRPLMLHCRNAYDDVLAILENYKKEYGDKLRGNAHFFAGTLEQARRFLDLGFTMSFTGVVTFARDYDDVVKFLPRASIMAETDSPYVAPVPHRGKRNEPVFLPLIVEKLAEIRGEEVEELNSAILENAHKMFVI